MVAPKSASNRSITNRKVKFPDSVPEFDFCFVQSSCHGLVLVLEDLEVSDDDGFLFLVNPVTREAVEIPQIPGRDIAYGLGYDSCTDDYKIVSISEDVLHICSVTTRTWRTLQNSSPYHYTLAAYMFPRIFVNGRLNFWSVGEVIAAFNLATEEFESVPLPKGFAGDRYTEFTDIGGCVGLVVSKYWGSYDIWMMKEYGVQDSWTKFNINTDKITPGCLLGEDEIVVWKSPGNLVSYNWKTKMWKDMIVDGNDHTDFSLHKSTNFKESLISPNYVASGDTRSGAIELQKGKASGVKEDKAHVDSEMTTDAVSRIIDLNEGSEGSAVTKCVENISKLRKLLFPGLCWFILH